MSFQSGDLKSKTQFPCIYEIELYKITKDSASIRATRRIRSNKPLNCDEVTVINKNGYKLLIFITPIEDGRNSTA